MRYLGLLLSILCLATWGCAGAPVQSEPVQVERPTWVKPPPAPEYYARWWGVRLKATPYGRSKTVAKLHTNDKVKQISENDEGWVKVVVERTGDIGWVEKRHLSEKRVVIRKRRATPTSKATKEEPAKPEEPEATEPAPEDTKPAPSILEPAPAQAAPPPAPKRKAKPEIFEPF